MLVMGDAHATTADRRAALLAAYREYAARQASDSNAETPAEAPPPSDDGDADGSDDSDGSGGSDGSNGLDGAAGGDGSDVVDAALHLGDLEYYDLPAPTWFVAGNNEDLDVIDALRDGERPDGVRNAHLLAGDVVELDGLRIAGLSGNFAPTQYEKPRAELSGDRRRHFVREDVERVAACEDVDVLLTHEAPTGMIYYGYDAGCEHVTDLLSTLEPSLCLVGHHHVHREAEIEGVRTVSLAPVWTCYYELDPADLSLTVRETPVDAEPPE